MGSNPATPTVGRGLTCVGPRPSVQEAKVDVPDRRPAREDLGPVTAAYVDRVSWRSVNLHTHISLVNGYVYIEVPKAGCGTMKSTLGGMEAARMGPAMVTRVQDAPHDRMAATPFVKPFQLSPAQLEDALAGPNFQRFTVVREPASRLLSGYLEKIRQGLKQSEPIVEALQRKNKGLVAQDITLAQFLDVVCGQKSADQDPHWRRQVDQVGFGAIPFDAVIHLEDLDRSWGRIGELTSTPGLKENFFCKFSTGAGSKIADYYDTAMLAQVAKAYAPDYEAFGYSVPAL